MAAIPYQFPVWVVGLDPGPKLAVFEPRARHDADEAAAAAVEVVHSIAAAQLAISDVEEIVAADGPAEGVPGLLVSASVVLVARLAPELNGDPTIAAGGQDKEELLEIGTMIFGVTVGDERCPLPADACP